MIKVLVVEDHPIFRSGAVTAIAAEPDMVVVAEAADAEQALESTRRWSPDVILTDIRLKGDKNGIDLARQVRKEHPDVKLMVLTNYSNEPYVRAMMEIGVEGYLLKDTPPHEVIESVRMVMEGRTVFSTSVKETVVKGYLGPLADPETGSLETITDRERQVLRLLVDGVSNAEIAESLTVSLDTVQFHLTAIYAKLGVRGRAEAIIQAARTGLVIIDE